MLYNHGYFTNSERLNNTSRITYHVFQKKRLKCFYTDISFGGSLLLFGLL